MPLDPKAYRDALGKLAREMPDIPEHLEGELAVVMTLSIRVHANKAVSIKGPIGNPKFCKQLLDEAWETIQRAGGLRPGGLIVAPDTLAIDGDDVDSRPKDSYLPEGSP